ncbi:hypothetical protein C2W62_42365 [Candidatus Entotheonella serta]|nr:hypothetical protein C2W62_42365 [Candidatus Entotheonella serta]
MEFNHLQIVAGWIAVIVATVGGLLFSAFFIWRILVDPELIKLLTHDKLMPVFGIPLAVLIAFCIVAILQATAGTISFKIIGLEFEGAAGPVVLWVLCFLNIVFSIRLLWGSK